jgi:hypothetical protein
VLLLDDPNASNHGNAGQISPDGKWIAYHSRETGEHEVYIKPYPSGPGKWKVSGEGGGRYPRWKGDGTELYFMTWNREPEQMMAVDIRTAGSAIQAGTPRALFATDYIDYHGSVWNWHAYAVSRDGQRFLIPRHNISGTWKVTSGNTSYALVLAQNGSKLTGAVRGCGASSAVEISEGVVQMDKISFKCRSGNGTIITYTGVNRGNPGIEFTSEGGKFTVDRVSEGTEPELERMARTSR